MVTLEQVKNYLRLDDDSEDELLQELIEYSKEEIKDSTGDDGSKPSSTYNMAQLIIIAESFDNRGNDREIKTNNILSSLYTKLKYRSNANDNKQIAK